MLDFALNQAAQPRTPTFRSLFLLPICGSFASFPKNHNRGLKPGPTSRLVTWDLPVWVPKNGSVYRVSIFAIPYDGLPSRKLT